MWDGIVRRCGGVPFALPYAVMQGSIILHSTVNESSYELALTFELGMVKLNCRKATRSRQADSQT